MDQSFYDRAVIASLFYILSLVAKCCACCTVIIKYFPCLLLDWKRYEAIYNSSITILQKIADVSILELKQTILNSKKQLVFSLLQTKLLRKDFTV